MTGISLIAADGDGGGAEGQQVCAEPAFNRVWHGTTSYDTQVVAEVDQQQNQDAPPMSRQLQDDTSGSSDLDEI